MTNLTIPQAAEAVGVSVSTFRMSVLPILVEHKLVHKVSKYILIPHQVVDVLQKFKCTKEPYQRWADVTPLLLE